MIEAKGITKTLGGRTLFADYHLRVEEGSFLAITGESGAGKTTLLNMLSLLEKPDAGEITIAGKTNPGKREKMMLRRHTIGYLFQNYALIPNETVEENLQLALRYQKGDDRGRIIAESLERVGLKGVEKKKVYALSGGEQQRVAFARMIAKDGRYIFADEPTGNLDTKNADHIFSLLEELHTQGKTVLLVTHDLELARRAPERLAL
ncbi:ABC superfamily ATP binding cassette transporter, ABC protein [Desmospora sp. 8437]|nr:ABC superfamily ATP binding cassette transporter, ABC protein [Desmospora sp. 8437]